MKTLQQIFDHVQAELLKQGRRASSNGHDCVYRAPNGDKCAAGHLLLDCHYSPDFERRAIPPPFASMPETSIHARMVKAFADSGVDLHDKPTFDLVNALQRVHDGGAPEDWRHTLNDTAVLFNLNPNHDTNHQ